MNFRRPGSGSNRIGAYKPLSYISQCITYDCIKFGNNSSNLAEKDAFGVGSNQIESSLSYSRTFFFVIHLCCLLHVTAFSVLWTNFDYSCTFILFYFIYILSTFILFFYWYPFQLWIYWNYGNYLCFKQVSLPSIAFSYTSYVSIGIHDVNTIYKTSFRSFTESILTTTAFVYFLWKYQMSWDLQVSKQNFNLPWMFVMTTLTLLGGL